MSVKHEEVILITVHYDLQVFRDMRRKYKAKNMKHFLLMFDMSLKQIILQLLSSNIRNLISGSSYATY